jgi:acyl dehydratase
MGFKYYWEDFRPGWKFENGPRALSDAEIVAFAAEWDPQRYHVDAEAAKATPFGGLIASGWQTCAVAMRLMCDGYLLESACVGSPGLDEIRWFRPVRPGDALRFRSTVLEAVPSLKEATRGTVSFHWELINQEGTVVLSILGRQHFLRRTSAPQAPATVTV